MKRLVGTLLVATALALGGCSMMGELAGEPGVSVETDQVDVKHGVAEFHGWVPDAVAFCQQNAKERDVLIEVTGLISKGFTTETTSQLTLVDPMAYNLEDEDVMGVDLKIKPDDPCVEVHYKEPVETTRWPHLQTVRGISSLDLDHQNKVILRQAINVK